MDVSVRLVADGRTVLIITMDDRSGKRARGVVRQLDLGSLVATSFLDDPDTDVWQGHFSSDGRWVTFNAVVAEHGSRIFVVPFRKSLLPRSEWIAATNGLGDQPRFSYDAKLIFFWTYSDGSRRLWAQRLRSNMEPDGPPISVYPLGRRVLRESSGEYGVGPQRIVFTQVETTGNVWMLEPTKGEVH